MPIHISRLETSPVEAMGLRLAARSMISGNAKTPSTVGMSGSPSIRYAWLKLNRSIAVSAAVPMVDISTPSNAAAMPRSTEPRTTITTIAMPSNAIAAISA